MKKEFKPTQVQLAAHLIFDQFVLNNNNGSITNLFGFVKEKLGTEVGFNAIKDELLNSNLLITRGQNAVYEYGSLGLELEPESSGRYLGYLTKQHNDLWVDYQIKLKQQELAQIESDAHLSVIKTNKALTKSSRTSMWVAILTSLVLAIQVGFQIWSESKRDQSLEQQNIILNTQQEQLKTLKEEVEYLKKLKIDTSSSKTK